MILQAPAATIAAGRLLAAARNMASAAMPAVSSESTVYQLEVRATDAAKRLPIIQCVIVQQL